MTPEHKLDIDFCKRMFVEAWGSSYIPDSRRRAFVEKVQPHMKTYLPLWAKLFSRLATLIVWEFYNQNFGRKDWIKQALREQNK